MRNLTSTYTTGLPALNPAGASLNAAEGLYLVVLFGIRITQLATRTIDHSSGWNSQLIYWKLFFIQ